MTSLKMVFNLISYPPERQQRLIGIPDLQRRGLTVSAISKILGTGEATIYRDLKLIKQFKINRFVNLNIPEELGDALQLFDEIAAKAMESHRAAIEDNTEVVYELDKDGQKKAIMNGGGVFKWGHFCRFADPIWSMNGDLKRDQFVLHMR